MHSLAHRLILATTQTATDDAVVSVFNSVAHLIQTFKPENTKALVQKLTSTLADPKTESRDIIRLRLCVSSLG